MIANNLMPRKSIYNYLLIALLSMIFFIPYLGDVHLFDWDEINFAEAAREMLVTGDYLTVRIDYKPFHEKPPLFIWLQALSMHAFGVNEFAARLPNAVTGIITLLLLYGFGKKIFDERFGLLWVIAYIGSFLPHFYFKSGIIDPVFNLFIFLSIYFSYCYLNNAIKNQKKKLRYFFFAVFFAGLAVLTKGPVGFLLVFLCWNLFYFIKRKYFRYPYKEILLITFFSFTFYLAWYISVTLLSGADLINDFLKYHLRLLTTEDAGHGGPFYYHFFVLLFGCFPSSVIALRAIRRSQQDSDEHQQFKQWMLILLCVVLVVFSIVETKIIHYSSLAYFPITFLAAYAMHAMSFKNMMPKASTTWLIGIIGISWAATFAIIPLIFINIDLVLQRVIDVFTAGLLQTKVDWQGYEYLIGVFYFIAIVIAMILLQKKFVLKGFIILFAASALAVFTFLPLTVPKIEPYTQGAPIEFFKALKGKDVYVAALGYKSYAQYFYTEKPKNLSAHHLGASQAVFNEWLLNGNIDKDAYFVCKNKRLNRYLQYNNVKVLYEKSGFVFFKREKK